MNMLLLLLTAVAFAKQVSIKYGDLLVCPDRSNIFLKNVELLSKSHFPTIILLERLRDICEGKSTCKVNSHFFENFKEDVRVVYDCLEGPPSIQDQTVAYEANSSSWVRLIKRHQGSGLVTKDDLITDRQAQLTTEFLTILNVQYTCTEPILYSAILQEDKIIIDACSKDKSCSLLTKSPKGKIIPCRDTGIKEPFYNPGHIVLVKGPAITEGVDKDFLVYLNTEGICDDENVLFQESDITSVTAASVKCQTMPDCSYFVLTTESGLTSKGGGNKAPNHLWLCSSGSSSGSSSGKQLLVRSSPGTISGYKPEIILERGFPTLFEAN